LEVVLKLKRVFVHLYEVQPEFKTAVNEITELPTDLFSFPFFLRIKSTVVILEQLNALSVCAQSTSSPNLSLALVYIARLRRVLKLMPGDWDGVRELKTTLSEQIEMRFGPDCCDPSSLLLCAALLDP
jgi:hypothetical protein